MTDKKRVATIWLDGCSGCHMSFLDMDERILELAKVAEIVYSPLVDNKEFPADVDLTLVEGAVATDEDITKIRKIRRRTKVLVSLGDCAVTANVAGMRNPFQVPDIFRRAYVENAESGPMPTTGVPQLLKKVVPVHEIVKVDVTLPGCPPSADLIFWAVSELLAGRTPDLGQQARFGA